MPRTRKQLEQAAKEAMSWLEELDPATTPAEDPRDLRRIGLAVADRAQIEAELEDAVHHARDNGRSWAEIARVLGTSKQAAAHRYATHAHA